MTKFQITVTGKESLEFTLTDGNSAKPIFKEDYSLGIHDEKMWMYAKSYIVNELKLKNAISIIINDMDKGEEKINDLALEAFEYIFRFCKVEQIEVTVDSIDPLFAKKLCGLITSKENQLIEFALNIKNTAPLDDLVKEILKSAVETNLSLLKFEVRNKDNIYITPNRITKSLIARNTTINRYATKCLEAESKLYFESSTPCKEGVKFDDYPLKRAAIEFKILEIAPNKQKAEEFIKSCHEEDIYNFTQTQEKIEEYADTPILTDTEIPTYPSSGLSNKSASQSLEAAASRTKGKKRPISFTEKEEEFESERNKNKPKTGKKSFAETVGSQYIAAKEQILAEGPKSRSQETSSSRCF